MDGKGEIGNAPSPLFLFFLLPFFDQFSRQIARKRLLQRLPNFFQTYSQDGQTATFTGPNKTKAISFRATNSSIRNPPLPLSLVDPTNDHAFISSLTRHLGEIARDHGRARSKGKGKRKRFASRLFTCSRANCNTTMPS